MIKHLPCRSEDLSSGSSQNCVMVSACACGGEAKMGRFLGSLTPQPGLVCKLWADEKTLPQETRWTVSEERYLG